MARPIVCDPPTNTPEGKKIYMRNWRKNNRDKKREYDKKYRGKADKEKTKEYMRNYYLANKEELRAKMKVYVKKNKNKLLPGWQRNYLKRRAILAGVKSESYEKLDVFKRDNGECHICQETIDILLEWPHPKSFSIDHIIPISKGGDNTLENVASSHLRCNISKFTSIKVRTENG